MSKHNHKPQGPNILIVDDDQDIVHMISVLLGSRGYCCYTAKTGAQGAVEFTSNDIDLVITDLNMPAGDGIALIERIRRASTVPIIIVTAFSKEYADRVHNLHRVAVLRKPFDSYSLLDLVEVELALEPAA